MDLSKTGKRFNFTGLVLSVGSPKAGFGEQPWSVSVHITDPSLPRDHAGLQISCFAATRQALPAPTPGSLVRCGGVALSRFRDRVQGSMKDRMVPVDTTKAMEPLVRFVQQWWTAGKLNVPLPYPSSFTFTFFPVPTCGTEGSFL